MAGSEIIHDYSFAELEEGMEVCKTHLLTSEDIKSFIGLTGDYHPLHSSPEYATSAGFDNVMAHGLLISSLTSSLIGKQLPGKKAIIVSQKFRYISPVYPDTQLRIVGKLVDKNVEARTIKVSVKVSSDKNLSAKGSYIVKVRED